VKCLVIGRFRPVRRGSTLGPPIAPVDRVSPSFVARSSRERMPQHRTLVPCRDDRARLVGAAVGSDPAARPDTRRRVAGAPVLRFNRAARQSGTWLSYGYPMVARATSSFSRARFSDQVSHPSTWCRYKLDS
jgi:hypothetical protein